MATKEDKLWVKAMSSRYLKWKSLFGYTAKQGDSKVWKGILSTRNLLRWVPGIVSKIPIVQEGMEPEGLCEVAYFLDTENRCWNTISLGQSFSTDDIAYIQCIPYPIINCKDKLCWTETKDGKFSVESCFNLIQGDEQGTEAVWGLIWKSKVHERLNLFLWRLAYNIISINAVLVSIIVGGDLNGSLCGQEPEEALHLFRECSVSPSFAFANKWSLLLDLLAPLKILCKTSCRLMVGWMVIQKWWLKFSFCIRFGCYK